jgi:hypothetical protein
LNGPTGIAVDLAGNVYISDTANQRVRKVTTDGNINPFAGQIDSPEAGDNGPALKAYLNDPANLAVSCSALYVNDTNRVRYAMMDVDGWSENSGIGAEAAQVERVRGNNFFVINRTSLKSAPN